MLSKHVQNLIQSGAVPLSGSSSIRLKVPANLDLSSTQGHSIRISYKGSPSATARRSAASVSTSSQGASTAATNQAPQSGAARNSGISGESGTLPHTVSMATDQGDGETMVSQAEPYDTLPQLDGQSDTVLQSPWRRLLLHGTTGSEGVNSVVGDFGNVGDDIDTCHDISDIDSDGSDLTIDDYHTDITSPHDLSDLEVSDDDDSDIKSDILDLLDSAFNFGDHENQVGDLVDHLAVTQSDVTLGNWTSRFEHDNRLSRLSGYVIPQLDGAGDDDQVPASNAPDASTTDGTEQPDTVTAPKVKGQPGRPKRRPLTAALPPATG